MIAQVTSGYTTAGVLLKLGPGCKGYYIQNNGTTNWRLSFDGGTGTGTGGTDPTATTGFLLPPGGQVSNSLFQFPSGGLRSIVAIQDASGTLVLDIITDDKDSSVPGHA